MEEIKKKSGAELNEKDIVYSKAIKAGKRIYYVDVKKNRKGEMFLAVTESKKIITGEGDDMQVSFEKHKIFLYREDFEKFLSGLKDTMDYICDNQPDTDYYDQKKDNETSTSCTHRLDVRPYLSPLHFLLSKTLALYNSPYHKYCHDKLCRFVQSYGCNPYTCQ